jgi:hypothetical protein
MSPPGRPKGEYRSAQHERTPLNGPAQGNGAELAPIEARILHIVNNRQNTVDSENPAALLSPHTGGTGVGHRVVMLCAASSGP